MLLESAWLGGQPSDRKQSKKEMFTRSRSLWSFWIACVPSLRDLNILWIFSIENSTINGTSATFFLAAFCSLLSKGFFTLTLTLTNSRGHRFILSAPISGLLLAHYRRRRTSTCLCISINPYPLRTLQPVIRFNHIIISLSDIWGASSSVSFRFFQNYCFRLGTQP